MHRFRLFFAAAVLTLSVAGVAAPAFAQTDSGSGSGSTTATTTSAETSKLTSDLSEQNKCMVEAVEKANSSGQTSSQLDSALTECTKAKNPLIPETNELFWGGLGFVLVFAFIMWKGYPSIKKGMDARTERIRSDLEAAETAKTEAEAEKVKYLTSIAEAKAEAAKIIEEARQTADASKTERVKALDAEIAEMRKRAAGEIESAKAQALADLRGEVADLAIGAAEQVVEHSLDAETNRQLVENFIANVGAGQA